MTRRDFNPDLWPCSICRRPWRTPLAWSTPKLRLAIVGTGEDGTEIWGKHLLNDKGGHRRVCRTVRQPSTNRAKISVLDRLRENAPTLSSCAQPRILAVEFSSNYRGPSSPAAPQDDRPMELFRGLFQP